MKRKHLLVLFITGTIAYTGCSVGRGCPTNGKNIGAERILSGDAKAIKAANKAGKFKH